MVEGEEERQQYIFDNLLSKLHNKKTPIFLNGYGIGKIISKEQDYVEFEVIKEHEETKDKKKEKYLTKEVITIPTSKIDIISTGEQRLEKTTKEKALDTDLGEL